MGEVAKGGRTVLFVSHNMASVSSLCTKGIVLKNGMIDLLAINIDDAISHYVQDIEHITTTPLSKRQDRKGEGRIRVLEFKIEDEQGHSISNVIVGKKVNFRIFYQICSFGKLSNVTVAISLSAITGQFMTMLCNEISEGILFESVPETGYFNCFIERFPFPPGSYFLNITVRSNGVIEDWIQEAVILNVEAGDFFGTGRVPPSSHTGFFVNQRWSVQR
jgi:lipopolysaccharide transport system ATP-binding protein